MSAGRLQGKVAIVTGATGGIGAATARLFLAEGAMVALADLDEGRLAKLEGALENADRVLTLRTDVADTEQVLRCVERTVARFGKLDVMFANAGIEGMVGPIRSMTMENLEQVLAVNVGGVFSSIKHAAGAMTAGGAIVVTSSVAGFIGSSGLAAYCASKHAVMGLVKTAAIELAPAGIRVNAINPGPIENRMMRSIEAQALPSDPAAVKAGFEALVPLRRYGTNEEIAQLAVFLASSEASYCTGGAFVADGGFLTS
jgi:NAD(P)-dependent dehydrogenase (short-subunit alcohol dehydrogenase family)